MTDKSLDFGDFHVNSLDFHDLLYGGPIRRLIVPDLFCALPLLWLLEELMTFYDRVVPRSTGLGTNLK